MKVDRNVALIIALEALWAFGVAFITFDILSALMYSLGGNAMLVALASTANCLLLYAPQLFVPYFQQRITHVIGGAALGQGFIVFGYLLTTLALALTDSQAILRTMIVVALAMAGLGNAFCYPFYQQLRLRLFPPKYRSASYSTALFFSQIAGTIGAALCIPVLNAGGGPSQRNYLWCFIVAICFTVLATCMFALMRDPHPPIPRPAEWKPMRSFLREFAEILRADRNLRVFLLSEWMNWLSTLGSTFIAFYGVTKFGEAIAAPCSFVRVIGAIAIVPIGHYVVTRLGARACNQWFYVCAIAMYVVLVFPATRTTFLFSAFLLGAVGVFRVNYMFHLIAALCPHPDKSKYYALTSVVISPMSLAGPFLGGLVLKLCGEYRVVFALAIVPLLIGLWLVWKKMTDPTPPAEEVGAVARVTLKRRAG
jgi:MFS family permease